jgi:hypothetical protein
MDNEEVIEVFDKNRKISVSFSRKISDGNYGTIEASAWVQGDVSPTASVGEVSQAAADLFMSATAAVLDQLGIAYEYDEESGVLREQAKPTVQSAQAAVEKAFGNTTEVSDGGTLRVMNPNDQDGPLPSWIITAASRDGVTAVWDNRRAAAGTKQPHFKEAVPRGGTGRGKDGMPKGYWPPR